MGPQRNLVTGMTNILVVDDSAVDRRIVGGLLEQRTDFRVVYAEDGSDALRRMEHARPDIVVTDINMPEVNGLSAVKEIINIYPDMGCIIMSSERDDVTLHAARMVGVQEFLTKPFTVDELEKAVERTIAQLQEQRQKLAEEEEQNRKNTSARLSLLAEEYLRTRRSDNQAVAVFEQLAADPKCEMRWLRSLAMMYVIRQEWGKLKALAAWLEKKN